VPAYKTLDLERDGAILRVWLNRPDRLNAISVTMLDEIADVFGSLERDFSTRVAVLAGRGRCFCAGADRKPDSYAEASETPRTEREKRWRSQAGRRACQAIEDAEVVTVARLHGHAIGGGSCLAMACDFRVAAEGTKLRLPEIDLGLPLTWGAVPRLLNEIGMARTRELLMLCEDVEADTALAWGMLHRVVPESALDEEVDALAKKLASKPEMAIYMSKTQLRSYARSSSLGDVSENDGDILQTALRAAAGAGRFVMQDGKGK
jgi:enoyl-CoA hydratase/carnithine racemase